jgi:glutathione synthase/RimK-type ligase-like ATP-grasp enzyme
MFNEPETIRNVSNKLNFFNRMAEDNADIIPPFWTNKEDIPDEDFPIVCRTVLAGHSGEGIVIADTRDELVDCSLYVKYVKKQDEYRIHVGGNNDGTKSIISQQRKARRQDQEEVNWRVRNHANGFNFVRGDCNPPDAVTDVACKALGASGLDFGAVDVIWNERQQRAYVLEINSAPGLEGTTVTDYVTYFQSQLET